ncbi:MAG TPA: hypothetical protein PLZ57_14580 [Pseudobdellovibrionaceae bacterium]|nr:hypothetical protein [Pseudobdellovibrionaceae bacterium]
MMRMDFERPTFRSQKSRSSSLESAATPTRAETSKTIVATQTGATQAGIRPAQPLPPFDKISPFNDESPQASNAANPWRQPVGSAAPLGNMTAQLIKHLPLIRLGAELVSAALISLIFLLVLKALLLTLIGEGL